jgi:hypothetical protein
MVEWTGAVMDGAEPMVAFVYTVPSLASRRSVGQASGHCSSTFHPPPS